MKKILYALLLCVSISCSDQFLDIKPVDTISETDVFSDGKLLTDYVNANYNAIFYPMIGWDELFYDAYTDNAIHMWGNRNFATGMVTPDNVEGVTRNAWANNYSYIRNINIFFDKINGSTIDEAIKNRLIGEMKFLRASAYAQLLWFYGGVPIIKDVFTIDSKYDITRNSYDEVVTFIAAELDEAASKLPPSYDGADFGRATKGAAMALKARVLLYAASPLNNPSNDKAKWQSAANAAKAVIDLNIYDLHQGNYGDGFLSITEEAIFARQFTKANGHNIPLQNNPNGYNGWGGLVPLQSLVDAYETSDGKPVFLADGTINPASGYDPQNPYANRDPRFYSTIFYNGAMWKGREVEYFVPGGLDSKDGPSWWNTSESRYNTRKWIPEAEPVSESDPSTNPSILIRLGEVYLNYAEALIALGNETEAKVYINLIRKRAGMPDITESGADLIKRYRNERRIELAFECHRFFDILRWKIAEDVLNKNAMGVRVIKNADGTIKYEYDLLVEQRSFDASKNYRMPIPRGEIDKTSGSLVQNPGYN